MKWLDEVREAAAGACKPATDLEVSIFESESGLVLPAAVREVYQLVGNGGFGPGYLLAGLVNGHRDDQGMCVLDLYLSLCMKDPEQPLWKWPRGVLPICHWGCAVQSCVDCTREGLPMVRFDPCGIESDGRMGQAMWDEGKGFVGWLEAWARGEDLWGSGMRKTV
ncbi:MAG TPA: SMI1/KNR4 family protein [Phycisphaerales bacterium]|nr:SMI1/KNR4 family protein [Phycisphaerales bacterium]